MVAYRLEVYGSSFTSIGVSLGFVQVHRGRFSSIVEEDLNSPAVVVVAVDVEDLLALDTQNTARTVSQTFPEMKVIDADTTTESAPTACSQRGITASCHITSDISGLPRTQTEYTRSILQLVSKKKIRSSLVLRCWAPRQQSSGCGGLGGQRQDKDGGTHQCPAR